MNEDDELLYRTDPERYLMRADALRSVPEPERRDDPGVISSILDALERGRQASEMTLENAQAESLGRLPREPGQSYIQSRTPSPMERVLGYLPEPVSNAVRSASRRIGDSPLGAVARYASSPEALADLELGGVGRAASGLLRVSRPRMSAEATERAIESGAINMRRRSNPADNPLRTILDPNKGQGVLRDPRDIAMEIRNYVAPESPNLEALFGVTRKDLSDLALGRELTTGYTPAVFAENPKGSAAIEAIMTPRNRRRLLDIFEEVDEKAPDLVTGMSGWYPMDPVYERAVQLLGPELGPQYVDEMLVGMGSMSPQSTVESELRKAAAERYFANRGMTDEFIQYGTNAKGSRVNPEFEFDYPGSTGMRSQVRQVQSYRDTGVVPETAKTDPYIRASVSPELSRIEYQNTVPVPDAHFTRASGAPFTRTNLNKMYDSMSGPELQTITPFWQSLSRSLGIQPVPAQAIMWGSMAKNTGVKTAVGAQKLEIVADLIAKMADETGVPPDLIRDAWIRGEMPLDNPGAAALRRVFGVRDAVSVPVLR